MKLLIFPKDSNPYQELLYRPLRDRMETAYLDVSQQSMLRFMSFYPLLILKLISFRLRGYKLLHLHWIYTFYVPKWVPFHRQLTYVQINLFYVLTILLGYKIIWTVHNVVPQFAQTTNDVLLMKRLSKLAKAKIIHSTSALENLEEYGISTQGTHLIPHGNYNGIYPDTITPQQARHRLGLNPTNMVILFFGSITPYKGVGALLNLTDKIDDPNLRVILAGQCYDQTFQDRIAQSVKLGRTQYYGGYIKGEDVAMYFKAADVVCLPFTSITTSGSAILALTFKKPLIAPRMGALKDIPDDAGYFYEPNDPNGLASSIALATADRGEITRRSLVAERYAQSLDWARLAEKTYMVYQSVLADDTNEKS